ncbi:tRNA pseudouridine synthase A [Pseudohaliea rubra DSM 19751]|uniref:tRNA pseudouridine synthase A n=1 Tax=Pseudohaliea rubra DSM 19751 TaxID=1265313 RepID=A0A095VSG0_9GAMM|nr:tRNA pseudouridine synthase A [Pseudohaliea rubra DSM 19751]
MALLVEYDGSAFCGWQSQPHAPSVQDALEAALAAVAATPVRTHCAGRTDTGVHATGQWVHFDDPVGRSAKAWVLGTNANLPGTVRVLHAQAVPVDFHARHSATARRYRYLVTDTPVAPALYRGLVTWRRGSLDAGRMHKAAQLLLGELDFSSFRAAGCQSRTPWRRVEAISVARAGPLLCVDITANAFLHHMVRNIAGALLAIGAGERDADWLERLLACRDRRQGAETAPPDGLYLVAVRYPERFALVPPSRPFLFPFPGD